MIRKTTHGFTLIEILVVSGISLLLMMAGTFVYINCMKIYRESQELTQVMQTSQLMDRDLRDVLGNVVPLRGAWITPTTLWQPGIPYSTPDGSWGAASCNSYYCRFTTYVHCPMSFCGWSGFYGAGVQVSADEFFSGVHSGHGAWGTFNYELNGSGRGGWWDAGCTSNPAYGGDPAHWYLAGTCFGAGSQGVDFWMPAFYGWRDGTIACNQGCSWWGSYAAQALPDDGYTQVAQRWDNIVGAWGWPRPDYRLNADADLIAAGKGTVASGTGDISGGGANVACWFYATDRYIDNIYTTALDNDSILLVSLKFTRRINNNGMEQTQLSLLEHHAFGMDHPYMGQTGYVRKDMCAGTTQTSAVQVEAELIGLEQNTMSVSNMLRAVSIKPYYLTNGGQLAPMGDNQIALQLANGKTVATSGNSSIGTDIPRCFDVTYKLRGPITGKCWNFALRVYCRSNTQ